MSHEANQYAVLTIPMTTLAVADEISIINVPANATIIKLSGSLRAMVIGTQTVTLKNNAGGTLGNVTWVAAGATTGTINTSGLLANDNIHVNITSLGVSTIDCSIAVWLKMASIS